MKKAVLVACTVNTSGVISFAAVWLQDYYGLSKQLFSCVLMQSLGHKVFPKGKGV